MIVVNPGSTSTKLAVYRGEECLAEETINHPKEELAQFGRVADQYEFRRDAVLQFLADRGVELDRCLAVAGRGGLTKPITGGVYRVNARMLRDLRSGRWGEHPSSLGAPLAQEIARQCGAPAFIADPVVVDEFWPLARYAGHPAFERKSRFHALSQRAAARRAARELGVVLRKGQFHRGSHGRGHFDRRPPQGPRGRRQRRPGRRRPLLARAQRLVAHRPAGELLLFGQAHARRRSGRCSSGGGGMYAYLGTNDCREVEERIRRGDAKAREVYEAMAYQIAKWVGASAAVLSGKVKAVVFTGGMARSQLLVRLIRKYCGFVAPFLVYPEMEEMAALAARPRRPRWPRKNQGPGVSLKHVSH